jgi:hypothetical protein
MARIANLTDIVKREVAEYAWDQADSKAYFMENEDRKTFSVLIVPNENPQDSLTIIVAHISADEMVIIDTDLTDKPLFDALLKAGIPRNRSIRAYRGETEPTP